MVHFHFFELFFVNFTVYKFVPCLDKLLYTIHSV